MAEPHNILPNGQPLDISGGIEQTREEYTKLEATWQVNRAFYDHLGGVLDGSYLIKHLREEQDAFTRRKELAWFPNYCKDLATTVSGHLFKAPPSRTLENENHKEFEVSTNKKGDITLTELMKDAANRSFVYGFSYILVDKPSDTFLTLREENEEGRPYAYILDPFDVVDWQKDEFDEYYWIKIRETFVTNAQIPMAVHDQCTRYRIWTRTEWILTDDKGAVLGRGDHNLGIVPIVIIRQDRSLLYPDIGTTIYTSIVSIARRLFNALSELDSIMRGSSFPILTLPQDAPLSSAAGENDESTEKNLPGLGVGSTINYGSESSNKPEFISPDSVATDAYLKVIELLVKMKRELARLDFTGGVQSSGVAMAFNFEKTNQSLLAKAERLKDAELKILGLVDKWMDGDGDQESATVEYPKDFNIRDMEKEIKQIFEVLTLNISDRFDKEYKKSSSRRLAPAQPQPIQDEIDSEIEEGEIVADIEGFINEEQVEVENETSEE